MTPKKTPGCTACAEGYRQAQGHGLPDVCPECNRELEPVEVIQARLLARELARALAPVLKGEGAGAPAAAQPSEAALVSGARLLTVPEAERVTGVPARTLRAWIKKGRLPERTKNTSANPTRRVFLVDLEEVRAVLSAGPAAEPSSEADAPVDLAQERATRVADSILKNLKR